MGVSPGTSLPLLLLLLQKPFANHLSLVEHNNVDLMPGSRRPSDEDGQIPSDVDIDVDDAALVRKIDMRVMPMLFIIYLVAFLDR